MTAKSRTFKILAITIMALVAVMVTSLVGARGADTAAPRAGEAEGSLVAASSTANVFGVSETGLYIVRFNEPALASYKGGIAGLEATSPEATGARKLDAQSPAALAYTDYLTQKHAQFAATMEQTLGRSVEVAFDYVAALNGMAVAVSHEEAAQLAALPGVAAVYGDTLRELATDVGPALIQAPAIWNGNTGSGTATRGEGVVIGVIDSGINSQHPAFAATDGDGYTHTNPYGAGTYLGWCAANPGFCNDKLIAAYGLNPVGASPEDTDGHGSHTASTAGGNRHDAIFNVGPTPYNISIQGVAPRANIVAYKVCNPSCPGTASVAAVNSAIATDQVDVLNYSISGSDSPWNDPVDIAFLDASNAGIFVSASAGNAGPGPSTVAKTGPWNAAVAASTHSRVIAHTLDVTGPGTPPDLQGLAAVPGEGTAIVADFSGELRYDATNNTGCTAFAPGTFTGAFALIQRGGCTFAVKVDNAVAAGATGVIMFNSVGGPPISMGGLTGTPPAFMLDLAGGSDLRDYVVANPGTTVRVNAATSYIIDTSWEDIVAGFSSRGPSQFEILKPDYIAPGVNILAAVATDGVDPVQYGFLQGTSMSSPHGAGAAALMVALHPTWSPAEVKSALATTAVGGLLKEDGATPADPFDVGSGRLDLSLASTMGLVFDETGANYAAANPALGGDPKTLNQPSVVNYNCTGTCTWTREVKSTLPISATYSASFSGPAGMAATVTPSSFTIEPGATQIITITADVTAMTPGGYAFGSVTLFTDATWPTGSSSAPMAELLNEQFTDVAFPPTDWAIYKLEGGGTATWIRDTAQSYSEPASARRIYGLSGDGNQDDWLVTPPITLDSGLSTLTYYDRGQWMPDYGYSGVWVSNGSCDPADNEFVELLETADIPNLAWRATPVTIDLSAYAGQNVCLAFRYSGTFAHTWWIDDVIVTSFAAGTTFVADTNIPVVVVPALAVPVIDVDPATMSATQPADVVTDQTLTISNNGGVDLVWDIVEAPASVPQLVPNVVLWDQPTNGSSGIVSDFFIGSNAGAYSANDFVLNNPSTIEYIYTPGFDNTNTLASQPAINWAVYADAGGVPAGHPEDGTSMASALWSYSSAVNGPGVDITGNNIALDLVVAGETLDLTPGTYWLTVYPSYNVTGAGGARWNWYQAAQVGAQTHLVSPVIFGVANWTSLGALGVTFTDTAFTLEGTQVSACDNPADVPWLSVNPMNGTTAASGASPVTVSFDSTGLANGTYDAVLCVNSNDPDMALVEVPVSLTVEGEVTAPNIDVDPLALASTQSADSTTQQTLSIGNTGDADLNWDLFEDASGTAAMMNWSDDFDSYATGSQLHGQGGWKGWFNDPAAGALTSDAQARSTPNSAAILGASDLVHEYTATDGQWVLTAWQYVPNDFTGESYFIVLNSYDDAGSLLNWSTQVMFDGAANTVLNDGGVSGGTLPLIRGQWVELRLEVDLDADTGAFYYNNQLLYSGTWSGQVSGGGATSIAAVDLFANNASVVYYDDMSLVDVTEPVACDMPEDIPWVSVTPASGTILPGAATDVEVTFDSTGLAEGVYSGNLCVTSDDPDAGPGNGTDLVIVPVELTVENVAWLQVAHLAPFAMDPGTAVTVTLNGAPALTNFAYGDSTGYIELPVGTYDVEIFPAGSATPAITATVELMADTYYSAIATGDGVNQPLALVALVDDNSAPTAGTFKLRLGHLAPFAAGDALADIRLQDGTPVLTDVAYADITGYIELPAGTYDLKVTTPGGATTLIDPLPVTFADGDIITAFATGEGSNQALGVFAWPPDTMGFFLPLFEGYTLYLPLVLQP